MIPDDINGYILLGDLNSYSYIHRVIRNKNRYELQKIV